MLLVSCSRYQTFSETSCDFSFLYGPSNPTHSFILKANSNKDSTYLVFLAKPKDFYFAFSKTIYFDLSSEKILCWKLHKIISPLLKPSVCYRTSYLSSSLFQWYFLCFLVPCCKNLGLERKHFEIASLGPSLSLNRRSCSIFWIVLNCRTLIFPSPFIVPKEFVRK